MWRERKPAGRDDHWDADLVLWSRVEHGSVINFNHQLFEKQYESCQYVRQREKKQLSQFRSCNFDVVFVTQEHAEMIAAREAAIRQQNEQIRDATIAELEFPIQGVI